MKEKIVIIGAGCHGRVCAEIAELCGYKTIAFLDDSPEKSAVVCGTTDDLARFADDYDFFVAIGNNEIRESLVNSVLRINGTLATLIHPSSVISKSATVGEASVVMAGTVVNTGAEINRGAIVNTGSSVDHDCRIGDYCHISVGAHLAGTVLLGKNVFVGAGAVIVNNISVCDYCTLGAGTTVISDITKSGTYVGTPARKIT